MPSHELRARFGLTLDVLSLGDLSPGGRYLEFFQGIN
jgi:hypothetical protein